MTKKQYLKQGYRLRQELKIQNDILLDLKSNLGNVKGIDYSKDKLDGGPLQDDSNMVNKIDKILQVEELIKNKVEELKKFQANLYLEILKLDNTNEKILLQARYILNETWEEIAERLGYSVMHIYRIHKKALENFKML